MVGGLIRGAVISIGIVSAVAENPTPTKIFSLNAQKGHFWAFLGKKIQIPAKIWVPSRNLTYIFKLSGVDLGGFPKVSGTLLRIFKK